MTINRSLPLRSILATAACLTALLAFAAGASAQGAQQEFLPDCSPGQATNCVVGIELNGAPTTAIRANVARQNGVIEGSYFQVYVTQGQPFNPQPSWTCSGGGTPTIDNGTSPPTIICPGGQTAIFVPPDFTGCKIGPFGGPGGANYCGDLTQLAPPGSTVRVTVNVGSADPKAAVIRGGELGNLSAPNRSWTSEKKGDGSTEIRLQTKLGRSSVIDFGGNTCRLFPTVGDCGGPTAVGSWTGSWATVSLLNLDGNDVKQFGEISRGITLATNAQSNGPPLFDSANRTLAFQTAAPHFQSDGSTLNEGFLYTFLPDSFLEAGTGFGLPPGLSPKETLAMLGVDKVTAGSTTEQLEPVVSDVAGGVIYSVAKFGFSSPKFDYKRRKAAGAFTSKATATKKKVSVTLEVGGKAKVSVAGKLGSKGICSGSKSASKAGAVTVPCKLSSAGKKALAKAKKGAKVNVKVTLKAKKTETKTTYALIP
ncbi:MAG: hypothetical protein ACKOB9_02340 [Solirubrobacterales bacterium]